jgi:hypothetical protein
MALRTRLWLDFVMFTLMVGSFGYHFTGNTWHEILGFGVVAFAGLHNGLNWRWYRALPQGHYRARRGLSTAVNALLLAASVTLTVSGLTNSRIVETYLGLKTEILSRQVHSTAAYWTLVLVSIHVGLHMSMIATDVTKSIGLVRPSHRIVVALWGALAAVLAFGAYAAFDRDVYAKLFAVYSFDFWDPSFPPLLFFSEYIAIVAVCVTLGHWAAKCVKHWPRMMAGWLGRERCRPRGVRPSRPRTGA